MHFVDVTGFKDWYKANESAFAAENEIKEEKLSLGINGLEWLVLHVIVDDTKKKSLDSLMEFCERIYKKDFEQLMKDAVTMDHEAFYEKNEINWWIAVEDTLTYLVILKERDYNRYFDLLNWFYER